MCDLQCVVRCVWFVVCCFVFCLLCGYVLCSGVFVVRRSLFLGGCVLVEVN